ncbi:hypothetical protein D9758_018784 [Tetrapyrgos nigripes]|uniref:Cytochrome P450 n=1 Tax=Tetrapyrgos nigripes TaxID=182062 RepID=A0A8H5B725_9AGAR|nr:hypothetical protein D9758_018784 [Tetrapyrgos nigripes]
MFLSVYGLEIASSEEDMPARNRKVIELLDFSMIAGWSAFKKIPFIHLLPSWLPGGQLVADHLAFHEVFQEGADRPWNALMEDLRRPDSHNSSLIANLLFNIDPDDDQGMQRLKKFGVAAIVAAADTTVSVISTFFIAMSCYPDAQLRAQQELDDVLGRGQMPTLEDRPSLPYIEAILRELMRWHPAGPMGIPHDTSEDIIYNGYFIPKGTSVHANIWAMTHDESTFEKPDDFIPERHLREDSKFDDINSILAYGFGRRVCPGRYMANDMIWLTAASLLASFKISTSAKRENVEEYFSHGTFCYPKDFAWSVSPRLN